MIRANFFLARDQCLELGLLDRFFGARGLTAFSRLDLRKDLLIGEPFERRFYRGFPLPLLDQLVKVLDELQVMLPDLVDSLCNGLVLVGERDHAHRLRKVRVARRADEQPVGVAARLLHERTEPKPRTIAMTESIRWQLDRVDDRALGLAALATDPDLGEITASPSFIDPEGTTAVCSSTVGEGIPVDVADVALLACPHETDRHDGLRFLVLIDELARPGERGPVDQSTRPGLAPRFLSLAALRDKPLGELYRVDPGFPCRSRIVVCRWGGMEHQGRKLEQVLELGKQAGLVDLITLGPVF